MHALIVNRGQGRWTPEGHQVHGFQMYERALRDQLGMTIEMVEAWNLVEVEEAVEGHAADIAFVMVGWNEDPEEVTQLFQRLSERPCRPTLVFLDYYAPASSPFFGVLPYVDCYFKRQMYRDPSHYGNTYEGGNLLTEFLSKQMGIDLEGWSFSSTPDPAYLDRMVHGWNLGVTPHYRQILKLTSALPLAWERRPFAVNCRFGLPADQNAKTEWYLHYRKHWLEQMAPVRSQHRCTAATRVQHRYYYAEMMLSQIGVSPFGWGEVCFRDYEVIASGALLIKPSMSHLTTNPDIFVEGQTYVEAAWDGSDLDELCQYYLAHPAEAKTIIRNGREALSRYFENNGFVEDVRRISEAATRTRLEVGQLSERVPILA